MKTRNRLLALALFLTAVLLGSLYLTGCAYTDSRTVKRDDGKVAMTETTTHQQKVALDLKSIAMALTTILLL